MGSNLRDIYNAIKANGDFKEERSFEDFASKMNYKGYQNQIYNLLKTNGAKLSGGPDTIRRKLGLQRIDVHPEWTEKQRQKRLKEMPGDGSGAMIMRDNPVKQKPIENQSAFVHSLEAGRVVAENNPTGTNVMAHDEKQRQLSGVVGTARGKTMSEDPYLDPSKPGVSMTVGQFEEKGSKSARGLLDTSKAFNTFAKNEIDAEFKRAREAYAKEYEKNRPKASMYAYDDQAEAVATRMANEKMRNSVMAKDITKSVEANLSKYIGDELTADKIHAAAKKMGVPDDYYAKNFLLPEMQNRILDKFRQADLERYMPRGHVEYILRGIEDSIVGKLANSLKYDKEQRQMLEEANSITQQGGNRFVKPGMMDNVVRGAVSYAADSPLYAVAGMGATAGIAKATGWNGVKLASRMANTNLLGKIGYGASFGLAHGFLTGASFGAVNGAVQNFSTSDDTSVGAYLKAIGSGALSSGVNFAGMEGVGGAFAPLGYKIGINGLEKTSGQIIKHGAQKVGFEVAKTAMEGVGMATGGVLESIVAGHPQGFTVEGTLESCVTAALFKLSHVKDAGKGMNHSESGVTKKDGFLDKVKKGVKSEVKDYAKNFKDNLTSFFASDQAKSAHLVFKDHEQKQIRDVLEAYGVGKEGKLSALSNKASKAKYDGEGAATAYEAVMNDKDIPWDVRNKFSAYVAGSFSNARPIMDYHTFYSDGEPGKKTKYVCEYSKDGELLSETPYKTNEERDRIVYEKLVNAEYAKLHNTVGLYLCKLFADPDLKKEFLVKQKGFDPSKPLDDPKNKAVVDELTKNDSELQKEYFNFLLSHDRVNAIFEEVGNMFGLSLDEMNKAYMKESMLECTDREANALVELRRRLKGEVFPENKVHAEQSAEDGKDVAENNNLGTEEPDNEAVVSVANELSQAEKEWQAAMDSNAELGGMYENLKKQGLRNDQIYEAMLQNGATEEDLAPLAKYINANAKMQGMVDGTAKTIEANVQVGVEDFSYKGTLNGEKQDGENMVYVTDADGRQLLVTSGDVAFDENGNPKEGVGDMLICRDEQTGEIVRVSASDVKFAGTKTAEDYGNEFRQHLQEKNSEAYAAAQQQQGGEDEGNVPQGPQSSGEGDGNRPQIPEGNQPPKEPKEPEGPQGPQGEGGGTLPEGGGTPPPSAPQEEGPKFADGTPVPMTKDSKGRPTAEYTRMTPEQGAEYMTTTFGDSAEKVVDGKIKKAEQALKNASKKKVDYTADDADILAQEEEKKAAMEQAQKELDLYNDIKKAIAKQRLIDEAGNILGGGGTDLTGRYEQERKQGYRIGEGGVRYERQKAEDQTGVEGREATVLFTPNVAVNGKVKVVEADSVQASHTNGQVNPYHFGPDWQPKDRTSDASKNGAAKIAKEMDPEQITGDGNAFIGSAPSVNERHEVIQGNNRTEALKIMYEQNPEQAAKYKQWLIDHAEEFGLDAEAIAKMEKPMMVNELPVDDAKAKELGQYSARDFETGGKEIPVESVVVNKLGDRIENFANILLAQGSLGEDAKLSDIIMANSDRVLQYLQQQNVISETQAETLLADRTALRQWLNNVLRSGLFEGDKQTEAAFNKLPENAKKAVLATYLRDTKSDASARIKANLQRSFEAYYDLMNIPEFANAKNLAEARAAVAAEIEGGNQSMFGEKPLREKYSTFELELAALYKGLKDQKTLTRLFNDYFDAVQGGKKNNKQQDAFEENVVDPISKEEAIKKVFESYDTIPAETQRQVDEAVKAIATEITQKTGVEIPVDTKNMNPDAPLHEYAHLWVEGLKAVNPEEWENVKKLFDKVEGLKEEVQKLYPELKGDDLYEEMITTFSGREGAKKLEQTVRELAAKEGKSVTESAKAQGFVDKVREGLQRFWKGVADMLHIHFTTAEEVADKVLADWAKGADPRVKKEKDVWDRIQELFDMTPEEAEELARRNAELEEKERKAEIQKKFDELKDSFPNEEGNEYSKVLKESKTPEEAALKMRKMAAEKREVARDWQNRHYKENNNKIDSHDIYGEEKTTTISAANERRRRAAINNALEAAKDYDEFADTILKRCGLPKDTVPVIKEPSQEHSADPVKNIEKAAEQFKEEQRERNGQILNGPKDDNKPWSEMTGEERLAVAEKNPLTEDEIRNSTSEENEDLIEDAVDYVNGNHGIAQQLAYLKIYDDVRNRHETAADNSGAEDGTQLAAPDNGGGEGLEHGTGGTGGGADGPLDKGTGGDTAPGKPDGGKGGAPDTALPSGEHGNNKGEGEASDLGPVAPRGTEPDGRGASGTDGNKPKQGGRGRGNGPSGTNAERKPAAKQGTTLGNSTRAEVKKEKDEAKQSLKDALKELRRRGRGSASISLVGMNSEQIEYIPEVMKAVKRYGMAIIKDGIYKLKDWVKDLRGEVGDELKDIGLSDKDIDDFIDEMWKSKFKMDGEVHTIEEWAGVYGREQLRKALATPLEEKRKMQKEAESVAVKVGDRENIAETLPFLLPEQQEDVMKAETQFFDPSHADDEHGGGRGMLFTNGTGTGKTYTGLGIVKRFIKQGKGRVLIVTPSQEKVTDWKNDATNLGITLTPLETSEGKSATKQKGKGAVITTFANFRANKALLEDVFDLVVYDESHKLMESKDAKETSTTQAHYRITNKDFDSAKERITMSHPLWREQEQLMRERKKLMHGSESLDEARLNNEVSDAEIKRLEEIEARLEDVRNEQEKLMPEINKQAKESVGKTKVVFLSATPFNTRENLDYVEGYLFSYGKPEVGENASAEEYARAKQQLRTSFYRQKFPHGSAINANGRLVSDTSDAVKLDEEERKFADTLMANGVMSGRTIDNGYDYSRDFPVVSVTHANEFNTSLKQMRDSLELRKFASEVFDDYNRMSVIYETMKVSAVRDRIKGHMERGRRIVVFHRRRNDNQGIAEPPFAAALKMAEEYAAQLYAKNDSQSTAAATRLMQAVEKFKQDHIGLLNWEKTLDYRMPREQLRSLFGDAHEYTPEEMAELNDRRTTYVDAAFNGRLEGMTPYEAGKKYGEACFDVEDSNIVKQYKPHKITDEEAEQMGIKKPSDKEYNAKLEAYKKVADEVKRGIDDAIKERIDKGIIKIELDENGKQVRHVGLFAGGDGKESKHNDVLSFNKDDSKMGIIVVQEASGKEGISLHDTTGTHQRVMINLALPQSPIAFIQAEGRIFRIGQKSNAIFEYPMLGIDNEVALFAGRFNGRAATTENLALGSMARGLRSSITRGILSKMGKVSLDGQGVGGREFDLREDQRKGGYDAAVEDYKNGDHSQDTSIDDMGTPEPIGYKIVEWANMREGESTLEPSAGNGNVSRYIPSDISSLSIEPDTNKSNRLMLQTGGVMRGSESAKGRKTQVMNGKFEDLSAVNKFDTVVMNSPNGAEGDTAISHLEKAIQHLNDSGRVVAVIPDTDKMNKAVDELIAGNTALHLSGVVKMPACAYTAGGVSQKTKIVVIDKLTREETRKNWKETQETDLSDVKDINTLFDKLKDVKMPERVIDPAAKSMRHANAAVAALGKLKAFGRGSTLVVGDKRVWVWPTKAVLRATAWGLQIDGGSYKPFHKDCFWYEEIKNLSSDVLMQYHLCGEVLKMSDKEIADTIFPNERTKQTAYVEDLKEYCKAVQKMLRGISGHTDGEMERAYNGEDVNSKVQMTPGTKLSMDELKDVFDSCNKKDEELGFLFDKVYAVAKDLGLDVSVYSDENTRTSAYYDGKGNKMRINAHFWNANKIVDSKGNVIPMNDQKRAEVITHELIHSVTSYAEYWNKVDPSRLPEPLREAATELENLYETVMHHQDSWRLPSYCREKASEFVAEASNPDVRNVLKKMGLWTRLVNAVKKFFTYYTRRNAIASGLVDAEGFEQSSAYTELDKVIDKFLNNFDKESYDAYVAVASGREDMAEGSRPEDFGLDRLNHKVEDKEELERLNKERTFRMYSTLQEVDGQYASPMAGYEGTTAKDMKLTNIVEPDTWFAADELDLNFTDEELKRMEELDASGKTGDVVLIPKTLRYHKETESGKGTLQYFLKKTKKKGIWANYNPYNHTSTSMMNDQFTGAYGRSVDGNNLVTVEWDIPESEKNSGYQASYAHDPEGFRPWHSGVVNGLLPEEKQRGVMLSRHRRLHRVIPNEEVARNIADQLKGSGLAIPWNTLPKQLLEEVAKLGVPITIIPSGTVSSTYKKAFEQQMAELKEKYPQARFVDLKMTKDAYAEWGKDGGTHYRVATAADSASRSDSVSVVENHVEKVSKKLGTKVNVVNSIDEVSDPRVKADIEAGKNVTGWYDEKTGEVHLYMPNVKDTYTAERTIWHETVGHKGMRGLLGDKFNDYLKGLWMDLDNPINKELREYVRERMNRDSLSFYDAIEEFLADAAEKGKGEQGFWANIKNKVTDALREIGYRIAPCTSDIKYMLWLAKNVQKHPNDPVWKMRAEAAKWKFDHEHLDDMNIHGGTLYENDGKDHSLEGMSSSELNEATDGKIHYRTSPSAATAIDRYTRSLNRASYMATEAYMDNMLSLKELLLAINPDVKNVEDIESYLNPYTLQNTMQGAMDATSKRFEREMMQPLDKAVANVLKAFGGKNQKERMRDFSLYLIKKHGLERNRVFYVRDTVNKLKGDDDTKAEGIKMQNEWDAEKKRLGDALRNGQVTLKEYYDQMDEWIRKNINPEYQAGEHDYSGMHGMYGLDDKAAYDDAAVIDEVMSVESAIEGRVPGGVKDLWSKIHAATMFSVYSDYKNGILSKELFDHVSGMFDWYVPLRKFDEKTAEDVYGYINEDGHSDNFIGQTISKASGRYSLSDVNILGQIGALANRAILNGGHNKIKQAFARFVRENYDRDPDHRLVTECDIWLEKVGTDDNGKPIWMEAFPDIPEGSTPDEVSKIVKDFEDKMKAKASNGEAKRMKDNGSIPYRVTRQKDRSEHIVVVSIAGKEHCFVVNANPRAAQALNGQLEQKNSNGWAARAGRGIIRWMAEACTSYNPEFVARNMVRDFEFASLNLAAKESARYVANFEKYYMLVNPFKGGKTVSIKDFSGSTGIGLFKKYRDGTLDMNDKIQKRFKEFVDNGGMTGFVQLKNMKDLGKEYESDIATELSLFKKGGKSVKDFLVGNIEHLNEIAENMARFATYCASRDAGRDPQRSAYDAKDVTVNFNRKGSGNRIGTFKTAEMGKAGKVARGIFGATASYLRQYNMFFNAGIQSTNMLLKNVKQHPVGTAAFIAAAPTALGILMPLINQMIMNALNEDDKDRKGIKDPYAELPDYIRRNNLCIYKGKGEFITIPLAIETRAFYGFGDMIHGIANGDIKMEDSPLQMAGMFGQLAPIADYLGNKDFSDDPVGATFQALAPSFAGPIIEWYRNNDWKGSRIENRSEYVKNMPAWMRANTGTYSLLIDLNKERNASTNDVDKGNPEMLGSYFWDTVTNPSAIQHFFGGFGGGVSTFAGKTVNAVEKKMKGETLEKKDIPFVRSFLYAPSETTSATRTKTKWYNYVDKMEKAMANIDRLKRRDPDPEKAMRNADALYKYRESNTYKKVEIIKRAQKEIKRIKKMRARTTDPDMVNGYDDRVNTIMAESVEQMDKLN